MQFPHCASYSVTRILREINFCKTGVPISAILIVSIPLKCGVL